MGSVVKHNTLKSGISFHLETLGFLFSTLYKVFSPPKFL